jgi:hypothetical protein
MPDESKTERPLIDPSEVARTDHPRAASLDEERAARDRKRRAENDAAAVEKDR